jgi:hypothetical protein
VQDEQPFGCYGQGPALPLLPLFVLLLGIRAVTSDEQEKVVMRDE